MSVSLKSVRRKDFVAESIVFTAPRHRSEHTTPVAMESPKQQQQQQPQQPQQQLSDESEGTKTIIIFLCV